MPRPRRSRRRLEKAKDVSTIVEENEASSSPLSSPASIASIEMGRRAFPSSPIRGDAEEEDPFGFSAFARPLDPPRDKPSTYAQKALDDFPIYLAEESQSGYYVQDEGASDKENAAISSRFVTPLTQSPTSSCKSPHQRKKHEVMSPEELDEPRKRQPLKQLTGMELLEKMPKSSVKELLEEIEEEEEQSESEEEEYGKPRRRQAPKRRRKREESVVSTGSTPSPLSKRLKAKFADVDDYQLQEEKFSSSPY